MNDIAVEGNEVIFPKEWIKMTDRVEKIERVARINGVAHDNKHRFNSGRNRSGYGGTFADELKKVMNRKTEPVKKVEIPDAYNLELNSCGTHSLFYSSGLSLDRLLML